ncbi:MAG TPA: CHAT domain-containing protein, partial [Cyanophyceae cyanobacterium]
GGSITIRHGGNGIIPFDIGDATTNGTAGAIASGNVTLAPQQSFPFTYKQDNIQIISVDAPNNSPVPPINPVDLEQPQNHVPELAVENNIPSVVVDTDVAFLENFFTNEFENYLNISNTPITTLAQAQSTLHQIEQTTGIKPALIYAIFVPATVSLPSETNGNQSQQKQSQKSTETLWQFNAQGLAERQETALSQENSLNQDTDELELVLVTSQGKPIRRQIRVTRQQVLRVAQAFRSAVTNVRSNREFLVPARQLYQWLVAPLEDDLQAQNINNLTFIMDAGLRSLPLSALRDEQGFIVEKYSVGLMPSLSLTDTRYVDVKKLDILAMGASEFTDENPLPAVPTELSIITDKLWQGKSILNQSFTLENLKQARSKIPYGMIHLATHGEFQPGKASNSYIQLWDSKLQFNQLRQLGWSNPPVELLVLSACRTALGDEEAELGFAGFAVQAGVKSALASLWYVSDTGTLGLMTTFYTQLKQAPIKAEALRQTQLAMLKGQVRIQQGQLFTPALEEGLPLPPELVGGGNTDLSHPYYWAAFTMIGNPW